MEYLTKMLGGSEFRKKRPLKVVTVQKKQSLKVVTVQKSFGYRVKI